MATVTQHKIGRVVFCQKIFCCGGGGDLRLAPPMLRNCSSALEESTAAAETGRKVVSGRALSCALGGVTTACVVTFAPRRRVTARCVRALSGAALPALPVVNPDFADDPANLLQAYATADAEAHTEEAILFCCGLSRLWYGLSVGERGASKPRRCAYSGEEGR